jgi:hypothetical protein
MTYTREQILKTVEVLQPELANFPDLNHELQALITQAEKGQSVENDILALLASNDRLREKALELLSSDQANSDLPKSLQSPAGNPSDIPPPKDNEPPFVGMPPTPPSQK